MRGKFFLGAILSVTVAGAAAAQIYPHDLIRRDPAFAAKWRNQIPNNLRGLSWLTRLDGVSEPIREVKVRGRPFTFIHVCEPHNCGDNNVSLLVSADHKQVFAVLRYSDDDARVPVASTYRLGGIPNYEVQCITRFEDVDAARYC